MAKERFSRIILPIFLYSVQGRSDHIAFTANAVCSDLEAGGPMQRSSAQKKRFHKNLSQKGLLHGEEASCRESPCREAPFTEMRLLVEEDRCTERRPFQKKPQTEWPSAQTGCPL